MCTSLLKPRVQPAPPPPSPLKGPAPVNPGESNTAASVAQARRDQRRRAALAIGIRGGNVRNVGNKKGATVDAKSNRKTILGE